MNLSALYKRLDAEGIDTVELRLQNCEYRGVDTLDLDVWPEGRTLSDEVLPLSFVAEVLGEEKEISLWELVEEAAIQVANEHDWTEARVEFSVGAGEVFVQGWDRREFDYEKKV